MKGWIANQTEHMTNVCLRRSECKSVKISLLNWLHISKLRPDKTSLSCFQPIGDQITTKQDLRCECMCVWVGSTAEVRTPAHTQSDGSLPGQAPQQSSSSISDSDLHSQQCAPLLQAFRRVNKSWKMAASEPFPNQSSWQHAAPGP